MGNGTKLSFGEKLGYGLGDGAANIAWRGVATFLFIFYTDVYGLDPVSVGVLMLVARSFDGVSDVAMGVIGDRSNTRYGKFRPWILWTAVPLAIILSLLFTTPDFGPQGKIIYAYVTYILFTLIYTANNVPYGALMAVMTGDDKERISLGSFRMAGAFAGGMLVQGALLYMVVFFGNVEPTLAIEPISDSKAYKVTVVAPRSVPSARIKLVQDVGQITWFEDQEAEDSPTSSKSFEIVADQAYTFRISGLESLAQEDIQVINQKTGYSKSIYTLSIFLALFMVITFLSTRERVFPEKSQQLNLKEDLGNLLRNRPWAVLLAIGLIFNVYTSIKQGITVIYFAHFMNQELLAASFMVALMLASIVGAIITAPLGRRFGKKNLFIAALIFSGAVGSLLLFCGPDDVYSIFAIGIVSEMAAAIFPTLFFVMLGDAADYSEWKDNRRATGLVYSAGSLSTKFGGGIGAAIIGFVLGYFGYSGQDAATYEGAKAGIVWLISWIPAIIALIGAGFMLLYPLNQEKMDRITAELETKREKEKQD